MAVDNIADLIPDKRNARRHNPRNIGMIADALQEVGAARSIVIDEDNNILAGNGTVEAAAQAGIERVRVIETDGNEIIAVRRSNLTKRSKKRLAIFDNRTAELADWEPDVLAEDRDILDGLFTTQELDDLLAGITQEEPADDPGAQIDRAAELQEKWQTERGQLWQVGRHRLLCGDSTSADDVARLMDGSRASLLATDPPYNVGIAYGEDVDDSKVEAEYQSFTGAWFAEWSRVSDRQIVTPGCNNLARWCRWFDPYHVAPWTKTNAMTNGKVSRWWCWEPMLFFGEGWKRTRANDVFDYPVPPQKAPGMGSLSPFHPCPKPLPMWVELFEQYTDPGDIVAEAFNGSGTTMVAAEQTGRTCYGMEIEPKYVAVALERMAGMGLEPVLEV